MEVTWLPFELHPERPPAGEPYQRPRNAHLQALAEMAGLHFKPTPVAANSRKALEAAEFARDLDHETFDRFHKRLFQAYFEEQQNIGMVDVLCSLADECGMEGEALRKVLQEGKYVARVDAAIAWAHEMGIASTPTFILGEHYAIIGAQDYSVFQQVMERLGVPPRARGQTEGHPQGG